MAIDSPVYNELAKDYYHFVIARLANILIF